ncbi:MAG TPA: hypothetical protein DCY07_02470 [Rhodospirillaceae bacterium]|nr:hypothetical protein [Rhodospirillaceae bacterium]
MANHAVSEACMKAERALLRVLDGSCRTPIAALARIETPDIFKMDGLVAKPDGSRVIRRSLSGTLSEPERLGTELGEMIKKETPSDFFDM